MHASFTSRVIFSPPLPAFTTPSLPRDLNCHWSAVSVLAAALDPLGVVVVGEVRAVAAAALDEVLGGAR